MNLRCIKQKKLYIIILGVIIILLASCNSQKTKDGTAWGTWAFKTNGERIYFTATSERATPITYSNNIGSRGPMMIGGRVSCASCHGPTGSGGKHSMGMMNIMDAKDIRWSTLKDEFNTEKLILAITKGQDPDGTQLEADMPRWNMSQEDLNDLVEYIKTL